MLRETLTVALLCTSLAWVHGNPAKAFNFPSNVIDDSKETVEATTVEVFDELSKVGPAFCVIGAGPSGITMTRHLSKSLDKFDIAVFEQNSDVGGQWLYTEETGTTKYGYPVHSSMYKDLSTNTPKELMTFADYPDLNATFFSFLPQAVVLEYIRNYTKHFDLKRFIQFNTRVLSVKLNNPVNSADKWTVQVKHLEANKIEDTICDNVVVCNGHVSVPKIPKIPGIENFKGLNIHSHSYRKPETFSGKRVVLLGARSSGLDIASKLIEFADKVYLSQRYPKSDTSIYHWFYKARNLWNGSPVTEVQGIVRFENGKFVLQDDSTLEVGAIIFCTGYKTEFPFLDKNSGITVDNNFVTPLYKHIINIQHPSMSFVGLIKDVPTFLVSYYQSLYVASVLKGKVKLPTKEAMMKENAELIEYMRQKKLKDHMVETYFWDYVNELAQEVGFKVLSLIENVINKSEGSILRFFGFGQ